MQQIWVLLTQFRLLLLLLLLLWIPMLETQYTVIQGPISKIVVLAMREFNQHLPWTQEEATSAKPMMQEYQTLGIIPQM